jgi:DNA-3-methyladenine glycosylase II
MITPQIQKEAIAFLRTSDPILQNVIDAFPEPEWQFGRNHFLELAESICGQQLSTKAADTIWKRFAGLMDEEVTAEKILEIPDQKIRDAGFSWSKIKYVKDLAQKTIDSPDMFEHFDQMSDQQIIDELVQVKGIGPWTAEMFLMFRMGRPDVFSFGDLGLRNAIKKLYPMQGELTEKKALRIAEKWRPYRTIACRYLWRSLEM